MTAWKKGLTCRYGDFLIFRILKKEITTLKTDIKGLGRPRLQVLMKIASLPQI
jgi:hypothetical protein